MTFLMSVLNLRGAALNARMHLVTKCGNSTGIQLEKGGGLSARPFLSFSGT